MALPWVRMDTQWPHNPKFLTLVEDKKWRAICVYMAGLGYAGAHGTGGFIPQVSLPFLHGTKREAEELVAVTLWRPAPGGWDINGWAEFQPMQAEAEERRKNAQKAARARWAKKEMNGDDLQQMSDRPASRSVRPNGRSLSTAAGMQTVQASRDGEKTPRA
jgi:hypothetical protein